MIQQVKRRKLEFCAEGMLDIKRAAAHHTSGREQ
jgi:hypothetical protein